ncbi:restriction endonuclease [Maribacter polysaccharolyticus]|uniref:restriction endonuclease n=1 Tax=Maribacter polysaccharolyticus TaxID=3020831 RepID=UPI00237F5A91|nr:restriction endonuclease [Maribacter polysaccharolyticus]MDE3741099.1 restriction endonuclease [Maribacter polysaccharolyticus]
MKTIHIKKYSGELEAFDVDKLISSLRRSQADESLVLQIAHDVESKIEDGMTTKKIYQIAFRMLKSRARVSASRYKLKNAIMELGPTGFPFEKFVGKILESEGYDTKVGVIVQGKCVQHEVDVIAQKENKHYMIECKYHSDQGRFCNVKIPLYIQSRFLDVAKKWEKQLGHETKFHQGGVYTNTRFTSDAILYGNCVGLILTSWDYPMGNGLRERIDKSGLHPLTSLTTLTNADKSKLLEENIVLCSEVANNPSLLEKVGIDKKRHKHILEDSEELCNTY